MRLSTMFDLALAVVEEPSQVVEFRPTAGFRPYQQFFVKESVKHPAKANLHMMKWIIQKWTKEDETILDPMAGTYSTCIMASLLNRNSIGVEYEDKFYKMGLENKTKFEVLPTFRPKGKILVLKGDARQLTKVLANHNEEIDTIITSPPYAHQGSVYKGLMKRVEKAYREGKITKEQLEHFKGRKAYSEEAAEEYGRSKEQIGNLKYGKIDAIVTSPPYEGSVNAPTNSKKRAERLRKAGYNPEEYQGGTARCLEMDWQYSKDKSNLGNLKGETYLSAMLQVYSECYKVLKPNGLMILITKNFIRKKKVVRLDLDTIKLCRKAGFVFIDRWYRKLTHFSFWVINYYKKYGLRVEYEDILIFRKEAHP